MKAKHNISNERALELLKEEQSLSDSYIGGHLSIVTMENWTKEVFIENCVLKYFAAVSVQFDKPVKLINCHFKECELFSSYFFGGLTIENCTFDSYLDFQSGGHNKTGCPVNIIDNEFKDFVNFFDCWYENDVRICNNKFNKGTNLLGNPNNLGATFEKEPIIQDNTGRLDFDHEGERNGKSSDD